ncbi:MAG: HepT-like ribonuclease domain-containing protein [Methanoregula sp.]
MTGNKILTLLQEIIDNIVRIETITKKITYEKFLEDDETYLATIEMIEKISAAGKDVPTIVRVRYSLIPWNEISGLRQAVNHGNLGTDPVKVWSVATDYLQVLKPQLEQMIEEYCR